jgi:hypothetical protein
LKDFEFGFRSAGFGFCWISLQRIWKSFIGESSY